LTVAAYGSLKPPLTKRLRRTYLHLSYSIELALFLDTTKPAIEVITGSSGSTPVDNSKPANEVITGFLPGVGLPEQGGKRPSGASEAYREMIELELSRGRNAMGIYQLCRSRHS
jgi:hypothetical protein